MSLMSLCCLCPFGGASSKNTKVFDSVYFKCFSMNVLREWCTFDGKALLFLTNLIIKETKSDYSRTWYKSSNCGRDLGETSVKHPFKWT